MTIRTLPLCLTLLIGLVMLVYGPIAQLASYHAFADQSSLWGVPHARDVFSNLGFALVGATGLYLLSARRTHPALASSWPGYQLFLIALILTAAGSAWYHLAPDNARLIWDRLPIALACAGLLAAVRGEVVSGANGRLETVLLACVAIGSVAWWALTEHTWFLYPAGDLRPYLMLQILPLVLIPLWQWLYRAPASDRIAFGLAICLYILAKGAELSDHQIADALHGWVSGHTIKHLLATLAAAVLVMRLLVRTGHTTATVKRPGLPGNAGLMPARSGRSVNRV